jgi:hypothetical protein
MRIYVRMSRYSAISLGPLALLILGPFIAAAWIIYAAALIVYYIGWGIVVLVEELADAADRRQKQKRHQEGQS